METITLIGGPLDGQSGEWAGGGDTVEVNMPAVLDFSVLTTDPFRCDKLIYRRSLRTRSLFVFQP
jgi:hypothetical protein